MLSPTDEQAVQDARRTLQDQIAPIVWPENRQGERFQDMAVGAAEHTVRTIFTSCDKSALLHEEPAFLDALVRTADNITDLAWAAAMANTAASGRSHPSDPDTEQREDTLRTLATVVHAAGEAAALSAQGAILRLADAAPTGPGGERLRAALSVHGAKIAAMIRLATNSDAVAERTPSPGSWYTMADADARLGRQAAIN